MKKYLNLVVIIFLFLFLVASLPTVQPVYADQQDNVNYIIGKIRTTLNSSLDDPGWKAKYNLVSQNIADLKKTLQLGGKITSNPVKEYNTKLTQLLEERKQQYKIYCETQEKIAKLRKKESREAINDIGVEMISRLTSPKATAMTVISSTSTKNAKVIKEDFARLKTYDEAIKLIESYKKSITPSMHEIRDRKHGLSPILAQYNALIAVSFDGVYVGSFTGGSGGTIRFTVKGTAVTGTISGTYQGDGLNGSFGGSVDQEGKIHSTLTGAINSNLGKFAFTGGIAGRITNGIASGSWNAKNKWGSPTGSWSASKK